MYIYRVSDSSNGALYHSDNNMRQKDIIRQIGLCEGGETISVWYNDAAHEAGAEPNYMLWYSVEQRRYYRA
jgi:hypothetical protein